MEANLYGSGLSCLMEMGGEVAEEWRTPWNYSGSLGSFQWTQRTGKMVGGRKLSNTDQESYGVEEEVMGQCRYHWTNRLIRKT